MSSEIALAMTSGYAPVNGLNLYYEVYGAGKPLVLIHGGFGSVGMFAPLLPALAESRQVIGVELQAHGHTADIDRPFTYEQLADDIAALISHLGLERADVLGYSLGGGVAWQTAIRHPNKVGKLITVSAPGKRQGWFPDVLTGMASVNGEAMIGTPLHTSYVGMAPNPDRDWVRLAAKTRDLLGRPYDWSDEIAALKAPVMIVLADADGIPPVYAAEVFGLLGGGKKDAGWDGSGATDHRLSILPGSTHYNILSAPGLGAQIAAFLNAPVRGTLQPKWVTKPAFTVVGLLLHTQGKSPQIPKLWDQLVPRMGEIKHGSEPYVSYGLMDRFDHAAGTMDYMAGNPVESAADVPAGMSRWDVPANTYAVFGTTLSTISQTFDYIFADWLPASGFKQAPGPYFERYGADFSPDNPVLEIYIPIDRAARS